MGLRARLDADLKEALKAGEKVRASTIRMLLAAVKTREVAEDRPGDRRAPLSDPEVLQVVVASCKQRRDSIEQFRAGGRADLVAKESAELAILEGYLPERLTPEELRGKVREAIRATGAASARDMGKVMSHLMPELAGRADGKQVSEMVREELGRT
ncbi:MAG: GatB/YqeY domain-containing protein [candidate division NC10 bacterium]|nr:GatB/YqeY domain-containing protein [candidate division NC10 bacterium]